ncbi:uncharacterized protein N7459_000051 [Penicillium hispanicum]|uniref:uncharacterized protein n=1 Tax=Penicillium hispanicum TaxID=1080232 RepID=UPI00254053B0|nr:uncharacterized protein N7459_000051 [Penicillium hispanicum]KAJ5593843.1 hypothetical protein N7459_000051 [Penicillium hispanicum]
MCINTGRRCEYRTTPDRRTRASREGEELMRLPDAAWVSVETQWDQPGLLGGPRAPSAPLMDASQVDLTQDERYYLDFFRKSTSVQCAGYFHDEFWQRVVHQASEDQPAIRHAVIGIGALNWNFVQLRVRRSHGMPDRSFCLWQINKAIHYLQRNLTETRMGRLRMETALVTCVVLVSTLLFQGDAYTAAQHLQSGYRLLEQYLADSPEQSSFCSALTTAFAGVHLVCSTFCPENLTAVSGGGDVNPVGNPESSIQNDESSSPLPVLRSLSSANDYIQKGREFLVTLASMALQNNPHGLSLEPASSGLDKKAFSVLEQLNEWQVQIRGCRVTHQDRLSQRDIDALTLLELWSEMLHIILIVESAPSPREMRYDDFLPQFQKAVQLAKALLLSDAALSPMPTFSVNTGVIPPLFFCGFKCRDWLVRQEVLMLLRRWRRQEGVWSSCATALILKRAIDLESDGLMPEDFIPESSRLESIHAESSPGDLGFRMWYRRSHCQDGISQNTQPWESEWVSYEAGCPEQMDVL